MAGNKYAYGEGVKTKAMKVPELRINEVKYYLHNVPAGADNPIEILMEKTEHLRKKTEEVEQLIEVLKTQVKA